MELKGKIAIVTGVSKGIGKQIVLQLLEKGAKVAGWGRQAPDYQNENFLFIKTDVRKGHSVKEAFNKTIQHFGNEINILVNNAGLGYFTYFEEMPEDQFIEIMEANVYSVYYTCREILPIMKQQQSGHVINLSSIAGLDAVKQGAAYSGAKHAVRGITESLFRELRDFGVKVTGIYPGSTNTNFFDNASGIKANDNMMSAKEVAEQIIRVLETSDNFVINSVVFRPLQIKKH